MYKKLALIVGVFVAAIFIVAFGSQLITSRAQTQAAHKVSDQFIGYTLSGKYTESYTLFTKKTQTNLSASQWKDNVAQLTLFFASRKPSFKSASSTSKTTVVLKYEIAGNDGTYVFTVNMAKVGGVWEVDAFKSTLKT